jgi:hypothetical protein
VELEMTHYVIVRHLVSYYPHWQEVYEKSVKFAEPYGVKPIYVLRDLEQNNDVVVICEAENLENAKKFMESNLLYEVMKKGGVMIKPEITYLSDVNEGEETY